MSERKVLNKYYPPDFDPSKIPRLHLPKERQYTVRLMAPFNMRCKTCGEYIYKGKKFNARKETVQGEDYLGIKIFRFYIKCTRCLAEITFKTDPKNADYDVEHGATRNFQALKLAEEQAEREQKEKEEEEASNPMKLLENRTKASKFEMEMLENLEELRDLNQRHANVDYEKLLQQQAELTQKIRQKQEDEDEAFISSIFGRSTDNTTIKRLIDDDDDDSDDSRGPFKRPALFAGIKPTDILVEEVAHGKANGDKIKSDNAKSKLIKNNLTSLVKIKKGGDKDSAPSASVKSEDKVKNSIIQTSSNALSLLSSYSGSDSDSDD